MKRLRTLLGIVLACTFWMGIAAAAPTQQALALDLDPLSSGEPVAGSVVEPEATAYNVWVGNRRVTSDNAKNVLGNGTVSYNASTNTLTLKNAKITSSLSVDSNRTGIMFVTNTNPTIKITGTNSITVGGKHPYKSYGIFVPTNSGATGLTITGSGKLTTTGGRAGIFSAGICANKLTLKGSAKVTARGNTTDHYGYTQAGQPENGSFGVIAISGAVSLSGSAQLVASGKLAAYYRSPAVKYGSGYSSLVKAGASSKSISVSKSKPASKVYITNRYVKISNRTKRPAKMKIASVVLVEGGLKLRWNTLSKNCTGYQLQLSKSSSFPSGKNTWKFSTAKKNTEGCTLTSLSPNTRYYVRVRGVNKVGSKKLYGPWSATRSAVTIGEAAG